MSNVYEHVCDFESAIESQLLRMDIVTDLCDVNAQIKCAASLGSLYQLMGQIRESIMNYEKAVINLRMKIGKNYNPCRKEKFFYQCVTHYYAPTE